MRFVIASLILVLSNLAFAFWNPGGMNCGTLCMNQMNYWGAPQIFGQRPPYMYPYALPPPPPMNFYNMPGNYWPMMPRWPMRPMMAPGFIRGVSSEEKK